MYCWDHYFHCCGDSHGGSYKEENKMEQKQDNVCNPITYQADVHDLPGEKIVWGACSRISTAHTASSTQAVVSIYTTI